MGKKVLIITCALLLPLSLCSSSYAWPIPDTGQTKCYDNTDEIPSPQPGEPFYGQDGNYTVNPPSYTKLDANGNDLLDGAMEWVMVRDNVTGLIWEVKRNMDGIQDYSSPHDADNIYTDVENFVRGLNSAKFGGYSDWRLSARKPARPQADSRRLLTSILRI